MALVEAVVLRVVQGIAELSPISSTAHLRLWDNRLSAPLRAREVPACSPEFIMSQWRFEI
jgi:undecaprenyl pyrophosphate phosphatase UppP